MTLQDKIGRQETVDKICGLVDSLQKDQNFCLSLNGAWGSGKTFVLQMIEEQLSKKRAYVIVKYDAWANTFYDDPLIAILSCIVDGVDKKLHIFMQSKEKVKSIAKKGVDTLAKISPKIEKFQDVTKGIKEIISTFNNPIDSEKFENFKSYQKILKETKDVLNKITQKGENRERQTKLIILVDEIDRCLPDEQLKILERMHHLFDIKNCAVVVAMNQDCIAKTVKTVYGIDGYEYLRKFFDFTFKVEMLTGNYIKSLFGEFIQKIGKFIKKTDEQVIAIDCAYQCLLYGNKKVLENTDNREITRYYQCLLKVCNHFGWEHLRPDYVFFVMVGLYIRKCVSSSFLNEDDIAMNEKQVKTTEKEMPYYDFLLKHLGINRQKLPDEMNSTMHESRIPFFSWYFNELVFYSISKQKYINNSMRQFQGQPPIFVEDCRKLRDLIILYGGEQELCEK